MSQQPAPPAYYVIGHPLGHSMSPFIHKRLFALQGLSADYAARDIPPERLCGELPSLLKEAGGVNVTIPHKQAVIPLLDRLAGRAGLYRSVNTIRIESGGCVGYNTDADGFLRALADGGISLSGRVALLGCGGVGRTFACEAALAGCTVVNAVREADLPAAAALRAYVEALAPGAVMETVTLDKLDGDFDLLINATPVGMYPRTDACPAEDRVLARAAAVFDAVYNPAQTVLMAKARANGARVLGGMPMLVWQAVAAQEIWHGTSFRAEEVSALIRDASDEMARHFAGGR